MWFRKYWCQLEYHMALMFILSLLWEGGELQGFSITAQKSFSVQVGLCVHIPCTFTVSEYYRPALYTVSGQWFKYYRNRVASSKTHQASSKTSRRFKFIGNVMAGDCSLSINDAQQQDEGLYYFRLEGEALKYTFDGVQPYVTVEALTTEPEISPTENLVTGKEVTLTCTAPGRCAGTAPTITWKGNVNSLTYKTYAETYPDYNNTIYSNITFIPYEKDHNSSLTCIVSYNTGTTTTQKTIILNVQYPPSMNITYSEDSLIDQDNVVNVKEGDSLNLHCKVKSNPEASITWIKNNNIVNFIMKGQSLRLEQQNISANDIFICSAENSHGISNQTANINVMYAPRRPEIRAEKSYENDTLLVSEGSSLSMSCSANSNPRAVIVWMKINNKITSETLSGELKLTKISAKDEGEYSCQATNIYGNVTRSITIIMTYKPASLPASSCKMTDNAIECICMIQSFPPPIIQWKINGMYHNHSNGGLHIVTVQKKNMMNSTLKLQINQGTKHNIDCIAVNDIGKLTLSLLKDEGNNQAVIIGAISGAVFFLLLLLAVILIKYIKKKRQSKMEKNDKSVPVEEAIYCSPEDIERTSGEVPIAAETEQSNMEATQEEVYMSYGDELQYVTLNFSQLEKRSVPTEEEEVTEYTEIKRS
ncbi:sialic acid-binding Ig-like lectin 10 [Discoglossus pictus]